MDLDRVIQESLQSSTGLLAEVDKFDAEVGQAHTDVTAATSNVDGKIKQVETQDQQLQAAIEAHESEFNHGADQLSQHIQATQQEVDEVFQALMTHFDQQVQAVHALDAQIHEMDGQLGPVLDALDHQIQSQETHISEIQQKVDAVTEQAANHLSNQVAPQLAALEQQLHAVVEATQTKTPESASTEVDHQTQALDQEVAKWEHEEDSTFTTSETNLQHSADAVLTKLQTDVDALVAGQLAAKVKDMEHAIHTVLDTIQTLDHMVKDFKEIMETSEQVTTEAFQSVEHTLENLKVLFERALS